MDRVWPLLSDDFELTVVAGPDHLLYWQSFAGTPAPKPEPRVRLLGFVPDVRPLYVESNLVLVPTTVSAGTNVKVLEAMAMERAVVSTTSGCAGLGLIDGESVRVADEPEAFARAVTKLIADPAARARMARSAREHAIRNFDWTAIGEKQRAIFR
jgi:glycosyltransferase involved in cell wall biosynthesis